ncbi:major facilitator superfamily domain-containing protein [Microdochium trichocladiopsis]|uniref:Major facilitator superfamily domain-containing protein n=1 Tax=Microdochium trichocladiopsis TaxID=1682393 RepID=A0A9P8XZW2_9PEZI|nr:major facilitator superfamily domain-containing protein [Microdochium trichocladiopsis]KAH7025940.1 major facilitator superfamily domain-containing protein [Microdochium trichocladiopsis]
MTLWSSIREFSSGTPATSASKPPIGLGWRSSTFLIVLTVNLAIFTDIFFYALIVPVIPFALSSRAGVAEDQVQQWVAILLACYSLALFVGAPLAGMYADHSSSRRWPLLIGLVSLAASTLLLAFGNSIALFVVGRLLQGFSAAIVWSVGCALLVDTMDTAVGVAMGYVSISMSVALLIAPVIGGAVYGAAGYYAVYYISFGVIGLDILLRLVMIEKKVAKQWTPEAAQGTRPSNSNDRDEEKFAQPQNESHVGTRGLDDGMPPVLDSAPSPQPELAPPERKPRSALVILIRSRRLLAALYGITVQGSIMMGFDAVLALFVQDTFGWNSTAAGVIFLAIFLPGFVSPFVGWLSDRYGAKWPSVSGFVSAVPILVCLRFVTENTIGQKALLAVLLALLGTALAFSNTPLMAEISYAIEAEEVANPGCFGDKGAFGVGYGLFTMAFALGGVVGPLWAGYVVASAGWGTMGWSFALFSASAAVVGVLWLGGPITKTDEEGEEAGGG